MTSLEVIFSVVAGIVLGLFIWGSIRESKQNMRELKRHHTED